MSIYPDINHYMDIVFPYLLNNPLKGHNVLLKIVDFVYYIERKGLLRHDFLYLSFRAHSFNLSPALVSFPYPIK